MAIAQRVLDDKCLNRVVSNGWWESFCCRNPNLSLRASAPLSMARAKATDPDMLNQYFDLLECTFAENDLNGKPNNIFNMDESGVPLEHHLPMVILNWKVLAPELMHGEVEGTMYGLYTVCTSSQHYASFSAPGQGMLCTT